MSALNREEILRADDIRVELVPVPEWDGDVWVKGMTGQERDKFEDELIIRRTVGKGRKAREVSEVSLADIRAKLCSMTICDKDKTRLFTEKDVRALSEKGAAALQRVFEVAQELSGITDDDIDELVEELGEDPFEGSASDLPSPSEG
jgi:hypothetical protein